MRLSIIHEEGPTSYNRSPGVGLKKRFSDLRSALHLIYGEQSDNKDGAGGEGNGGRPKVPGVGELPQTNRDPGARDQDPGAAGGGSGGIPWKARHRKFLGVNPSG